SGRLPRLRPQGCVDRFKRAARQLAVRRGPADGPQGEADGGEAAGAGEAGDRHAPTRNRGARPPPPGGTGAPRRRGGWAPGPPAGQVPYRRRPLRPGGQGPPGGGPAARPARGDGRQSVGASAGAVAKRLARRGLAVTGTVLAAALPQQTASAAVPPAVLAAA